MKRKKGWALSRPDGKALRAQPIVNNENDCLPACLPVYCTLSTLDFLPTLRVRVTQKVANTELKRSNRRRGRRSAKVNPGIEKKMNTSTNDIDDDDNCALCLNEVSYQHTLGRSKRLVSQYSYTQRMIELIDLEFRYVTGVCRASKIRRYLIWQMHLSRSNGKCFTCPGHTRTL